MPYIVTTTRYIPHLPPQVHEILSSHAVATLDEARDHVTGLFPFPQYGHKTTERVGNDLSAMTDAGGPVGPLPDGTVIEVTPVCWNWIIAKAEDAGIDTEAVHGDAPSGSGDLAILAAYNAR